MNPNIPVYVGIAGFLTLILGILCSGVIFPKLKVLLIEKQTALEDDSFAYETWKKPPIPFKLKVYFFNVTNPDEFINGAQPKFKELGPYIYDEYRLRQVIAINEENDTIKYFQRKNYFFNQDESGCRSENDTELVHKGSKINAMVLPMIDDSVPFLFPNTKDILMTKSVREILFDGIRITCKDEQVSVFCDGMEILKASTLRKAEDGIDFLVSFFYHANSTAEGPYEINRGINDVGVKGHIIGFNDKTELVQWKGEYCQTIKGTDLTINPPLYTVPEQIEFFAPEICRSLSAQYVQKQNYQQVEVYNFTTKYTFGQLKEETCYCSDDEENPDCSPLGTMNLRQCSGTEILISQPHFIHADKSLGEKMVGLKPDPKKHDTYVLLEPRTGVVLNAKIRLQMNAMVQQSDVVSIFRNITTGIYPFLWIELGAELPLKMIETLQSGLDKLIIFTIIKYILIVAGIILLSIALILAMMKDKLVCFKQNLKSGSASSQINFINGALKMNKISIEDITNKLKYPRLYPQLYNKNISGNLFIKKEIETPISIE